MNIGKLSDSNFFDEQIRLARNFEIRGDRGMFLDFQNLRGQVFGPQKVAVQEFDEVLDCCFDFLLVLHLFFWLD